MEFDFNGSGKRVIAQEFFRIGSHCFRLFFQCLFFRDIFGLFHERFLIQLLLQFQDIRLFHIVANENGETDILADIYGKIVRRKHEEHNQPQQQQHQRGTDTRRNKLHIENRT